uniref:Uncharacterized protein n=1 Tax=Populus trichocarpa TaxID=3694 RepID=A0A3N7G858_POPTR
MVQLDQPIRPCGSRWHRPVILPLPGAGSDRCSVRPASRCALPSRSHDTQVFTRMPWLNSWLGTGGPDKKQPEPDLTCIVHVPSL